jgi:hypothetical protein
MYGHSLLTRLLDVDRGGLTSDRALERIELTIHFGQELQILCHHLRLLLGTLEVLQQRKLVLFADCHVLKILLGLLDVACLQFTSHFLDSLFSHIFQLF